jgi:predicted nucleotidyltransferase
MTEPTAFYTVDRSAEIVERLRAIEKCHNVRILYAIESGSRAWGFASPNSDWDVRFIYVHTEDWYLSVHKQRDVIEIPIDDDLDISGWELRKALRLMQKGNPVLFEWLCSPILYLAETHLITHKPFTAKFRNIAQPYFNPTAAVYHYWHMAKGNFREYLHGDVVKLKKYFYVLRPILSCLWILRGLGQPPIVFQELLAKLIPQGALLTEIEGLLVLKQSAAEMAEGPRQPAINEFIVSSLEEIGIAVKSMSRIEINSNAKHEVDRFFRKVVRSVKQ